MVEPETVQIRWAFCAADMSKNGTEDTMLLTQAINLQQEGRVVILGGPEAGEVDKARAQSPAPDQEAAPEVRAFGVEAPVRRTKPKAAPAE